MKRVRVLAAHADKVEIRRGRWRHGEKGRRKKEEEGTKE